MNIRKVTLKDFESISIVNIGDVHYGNPACDREGLKNLVVSVEKTEFFYWVSTGDLLEVALDKKNSDVYNSLSLHQEFNELVEILQPIKNKCLGIVGSNHHQRLEKKVGLNLDKLIAQALDIDYLGYLGFLKVGLQDSAFYICMHHGFGGGRSEGSKINNMVYFSSLAKGFDLYLTGHTHTYNVSVTMDLILDRKHDRVSEKVIYHICTGHFLDYNDSYAVRAGYKPKPKWCAKIDLIGCKWNKFKQIKPDKIEIRSQKYEDR